MAGESFQRLIDGVYKLDQSFLAEQGLRKKYQERCLDLEDEVRVLQAVIAVWEGRPVPDDFDCMEPINAARLARARLLSKGGAK